MFNTDKKYKTIYIDPPWPEYGGGKIKRGADKHYELMNVKDIKAMPIKDLIDQNGGGMCIYGLLIIFYLMGWNA